MAIELIPEMICMKYIRNLLNGIKNMKYKTETLGAIIFEKMYELLYNKNVRKCSLLNL